MNISNDKFLEVKKSLVELEDYNFLASDLNCDVTKIVDFLWNNPEYQNPNSIIYKFFKNLFILKYAVNYEIYDNVESILDIKIDFPFISLGNILPPS